MEPLEAGGFNGYAHVPEQLRDEVVAVGFVLEALASVEGLSSVLPDLDARLADEEERVLLLDTLRAAEAEPSLLGFGPHLLAVARKP